MFGYATDETEECMPQTLTLAHALNRRLADCRRNGTLPWLRPDTKTQVSVCTMYIVHFLNIVHVVHFLCIVYCTFTVLCVVYIYILTSYPRCTRVTVQFWMFCVHQNLMFLTA